MEARALHQLDDHGSFEETHEDRGPEPLGLAPEPVEIRRNGGLAALLGVVASAVGIAYLARADPPVPRPERHPVHGVP